ATLLEIGGYSESKAKQYINNIRQKILLYETKRIAKKCRINTLEYELDLYEREPLENFENENNNIETNTENNGLLCWKLLLNRFPILGQMACDILSMQPSSVASERAFSRAGFNVTNDRANLNENT
ncbi:26522_t:CDS:2, partial [Gigaspora margarita]